MDQILELGKSTEGFPSLENDTTVYYDSTYNSRILIKFDLTEVSGSIVRGKIDSSSATYYLNLKGTTADSLPISYDVYVFPISSSWSNGTGYFGNNPQVTNGASWNYRTGKLQLDRWATSSFNPISTGSFSTIPGGSTWYTSSFASQSFNHSDIDLRVNVTGIVNRWLDGTYPNNGFIVKFPAAVEQDNSVLGNIQFFSKESHTIFIPKLEIYWNDVDLSGTSSITEIGEDDFVVAAKNMKYVYSDTEISKVRFLVREKYPQLSYATSSYYLQTKRFPISSYFQIQDVVTDEIIIPFDPTGTKLNCDTNGNYLKLDCTSLMPERKYKLVLKSEWGGGDTVKIIDENFVFGIKRN
jgi:hypothetical protein